MATLQELADIVQGDVQGDPSMEISGVSEIQSGKAGTITFLSSPKFREYLTKTNASAIVISSKMEINGINCIRVENPALAFSKILDHFSDIPKEPKIIHPTAIINDDVILGKNIYIGAFTTIDKGATIGDNVSIGPQTFIGRDSIIGDDTVLYPQVVIYHNCKVGKNVLIHSGTVIGSDGFGFVTDGGEHKKVPQLGGVTIGDDVEIGSNCSIDRGTIGDTVIGKGSKLDNLVHIAHNVKLGRGCLVTGLVGIAGSSEIGDYVSFGGQAGVNGHVKVGSHTKIAAKTGVTKSIPGGKTYAGMPAREIYKKNKADAMIYRLPDLFKRIKDIEKELKRFKETR